MRLVQKIRHSFIFKHAFFLLLILALVLGLGFCLFYFFMQKKLDVSVEQMANLTCQKTINLFDQSFFRCESIANTLASVLAERPQQEWTEVLKSALKSIVTTDEKKILAVAVATIPDNTGGKLSVIQHNPSTDNGQPDYGDFQILTGTEYANETWFADVVKDGKGKWIEPFLGHLVHELIAVYARPIFKSQPDGSQKIIGVVCVDIGVRWMDNEISGMRLDYRGRAFLISDKMQLLSVSNKEAIGKNFYDLDIRKQVYAYDRVVDGFEKFNEFETLLTQKCSGNFTLQNERTGSRDRFFLQPMRSTGWCFGVLFPEAEIGSQIRFFHCGIIIMSIVFFVVIVSFVFSMSYKISRALQGIRNFAKEIGNGNFSAPVPKHKGKDEFVVLIATINRMRTSLINYMKNLKQITATNERFESELQVARKIQYGLMPDIRPPFPGSVFFEASSKLFSAREIGGDLYDCTMIAPDKLYFVIGDVSGKGIPAALFMVFTQVIQRTLRHSCGMSPKTLVSKMNDMLFTYNRERFFVTFTCGFIDAETGIVTYCNAGHTPFFILRKDGSLDDSCQKNGIPLGFKAGLVYTESQCQIEPGETIVFYTDGITEAENSDGEFYGVTRFKTILRKCAEKNLSADEIILEIMESVRKFASPCEQSDDITCLTIQYKKTALCSCKGKQCT